MLIHNSKKDKLLNAYIDSIYQQSTGFQSYSSEEKNNYMAEDICYVYGELLYPSTVKLIKKLNLNESDTLLDLGSGLGKFALQVFVSSCVGNIVGIEATKPLFDQSQVMLGKLKKEVPFFWEPNRTLNLIYGNFLEQDWSPARAVYSCSTCFTRQLIGKIGDKINQTDSIQDALSLRPIHTLERLKLHQVFRVECSWDSALCYWYKLL